MVFVPFWSLFGRKKWELQACFLLAFCSLGALMGRPPSISAEKGFAATIPGRWSTQILKGCVVLTCHPKPP